VRVGIEASIDSALLTGFEGLKLVRIPAEPTADMAVDFWIASLNPSTSRRQWPHLKGVKAVQGLWAGVDALRPLIPADITLCNARGVHDAPTAEWAVTAVLAMQNTCLFMLSCNATPTGPPGTRPRRSIFCPKARCAIRIVPCCSMRSRARRC